MISEMTQNPRCLGISSNRAKIDCLKGDGKLAYHGPSSVWGTKISELLKKGEMLPNIRTVMR